MKILLKILFILFFSLSVACSSGFNSKKAGELLEKETLTTEDYTEMLRLYENGIDDAIKFSKESPTKLDATQKEEMMLIFAIGMRLSKDDVNLTEQQRKDFERINLKGTEETQE